MSLIALGAIWALSLVPAWGKRHHAHRKARVTPSGACAGADTPPQPGQLAEAKAATLCLVNEQRRNAGLVALRDNRKLDRIARAHSDDMVRRDYFAHTAPGSVTLMARIRGSGYLSHSSSFDLGENLGEGTGSVATPATMVAAWMRSPEHRANILEPAYRDSGIGIAIGVPASFADGSGGATYTQDFGRRR